MEACKHNDLAYAREAVQYANLNVNVEDESGRTPLIVAAEHGTPGIVLILLKRKDLDVNKVAGNHAVQNIASHIRLTLT